MTRSCKKDAHVNLIAVQVKVIPFQVKFAIMENAISNALNTLTSVDQNSPVLRVPSPNGETIGSLHLSISKNK